uniref:Uncharacterized protein n=1 Tax=Oryza glumipatula TaxID=40148 RepID=A0A0E0AMS8_9ORYZ
MSGLPVGAEEERAPTPHGDAGEETKTEELQEYGRMAVFACYGGWSTELSEEVFTVTCPKHRQDWSKNDYVIPKTIQRDMHHAHTWGQRVERNYFSPNKLLL